MRKITIMLLMLILVSCTKEEEIILENIKINKIENNDMGKIINAYGGFTATSLKNRASIPLQANMTVNGSTVDCSNISISLIKNVLASSSTNLSDLCTDANVNIWSGFAPTEWYISGENLLNRVKTPYSIGSFAGYNHNAVQPSIQLPTNSVIVNSGVSTLVRISAFIDLGEINWNFDNINKIAVKSTIDGVTQNIIYYPNTANYVDMESEFNVNVSTTKTIVTELYFATNSNTKICNIPNISNFNTTANISVPARIQEIIILFSPETELYNLYYSNPYLTQASNAYSITFNGIMDMDNNQWVNNSFSLYAKLDNGLYINCNKTITFNGTNATQTITGTLPFSIQNDNVVYFRLQ